MTNLYSLFCFSKCFHCFVLIVLQERGSLCCWPVLSLSSLAGVVWGCQSFTNRYWVAETKSPSTIVESLSKTKDKLIRYNVAQLYDIFYSGIVNIETIFPFFKLFLFFRKDHFLCEERECEEAKFVVFRSEIDLKGVLRSGN